MASSFEPRKRAAQIAVRLDEPQSAERAGEGTDTPADSSGSAPNAYADPALIRARVSQLAAETGVRVLRTLLTKAETTEHHFRALLEAAPDAVVITDREGRILLVNHQTEVMFGYERAELLGQVIEALMPERYRALHTAHRQRYMAEPYIRPMGAGLEIVGRRRDGSEFPIEISLSPTPTQLGMHVVAAIRDVSERKRAENALKESERFVRSTFDALPEHICVLDEAGTLVAVNEAWREFGASNGGDSSRTGEGVNYLAVCDAATGEGAAEAQAFAADLRAVLRGERNECAIEYPCQSSAGWRWYLCRVTRFPKEGPARWVVVHEDITDLKQAELALRKANEVAEAAQRQEVERRQEAERRRNIAESLRDVMSILNSDRPLGDVLEYIASHAYRLLSSHAVAVYRSGAEGELALIQAGYGAPLTDLGEHVIRVDSETLRLAIAARDAITIVDGSKALAERAAQSARDKSSTFVIPVVESCPALMAVPVLINDEVYGGLVFYDVAPRVFSHEEIELATMFADQAALAIENARLKEQAAKAAAASERNRLARDLHDAVTQGIFSATLIADALPRVWERNPQEGQRGLKELGQLTRGALAELRTLLFELRPAALLDKPLPDLLRQLTEAMASRSHIAIIFTTKGSCLAPPAVHVAFYRIAQEALNNVVKHAEARRVTVMLQCSPQRMALRIQDDGHGFDVSAVKADHLGITNMRERANSIGGVCRIVSKVGSGAQVFVTWSASGAASHKRLPVSVVNSSAARRLDREHSQIY